MRLCEVPGCGGEYVAAGLCRMHYSRRRRGAPLDDARPRPGDPSGVGIYGDPGDDGETVRCHECGYRSPYLSRHVTLEHGLSPRAYKLRHGLPLSRGLVSAARHGVLSESARSRVGTAGWRRLEAARDPEAASRARGEESMRSPAHVSTARARALKMSADNTGPLEWTCTDSGTVGERRPGGRARRYCDDCTPRFLSRALPTAAWEASAKRRAPRDARIVQMWSAGASTREIADATGLTTNGARLAVQRLTGR